MRPQALAALRLRRGVALVLVAPVVSLLPTSTAHAASTCHGLLATIEASAGLVTGTPGPDVIVVTGIVTRVEAGDGDDLICLVGTSEKIGVDPGAGDDEVDATAAGANTYTYLGAGADSFIGSTYADWVSAGTLAPMGTMGDPGPDRVATGPGRDSLGVALGNTVDAHLGNGADRLFFSTASGFLPASSTWAPAETGPRSRTGGKTLAPVTPLCSLT